MRLLGVSVKTGEGHVFDLPIPLDRAGSVKVEWDKDGNLIGVALGVHVQQSIHFRSTPPVGLVTDVLPAINTTNLSSNMAPSQTDEPPDPTVREFDL